jgi:hypothetical protein
MAQFELYFKDFYNEQLCSVEKVEVMEKKPTDLIEIVFYDKNTGCENISHSIYFDKSTAIKFAKTLRTEINKITEEEVKDGSR